ncbi:glycosyltransferase [Ignatzschineria sp. LJL83]
MSTEQRPLRIGILLRNRHDGPGGLEKVLEIVAREIPKQNVELKFYALYSPQYDDFTKEFISLTCLPLPRSLSLLEKILPTKIFRIFQKSYVKRNGMKLFTLMQSDELDLLITLDLSKQFLGNYEFLKTFKEQVNIPILSWVHSSLSSNSSQIAQAVKDRIHLFDGHLAISSGISKELERDYGAQDIDVVYNPVNCAEPIVRNPRKFIYMGRIDSNKRVDSLLLQLKKLVGNWTLDIYGSTGRKEKDQKFIQKIMNMGLGDKVVFHGWKENAWAEIQSAGVLLLNSKREAFGLVIVEAMQRGIPVLATATQGAVELIKPGTNGWIYAIDDEAAGVEVLEGILMGNIPLPEALGIVDSVSQYITVNYIECFMQAIQSVLKTKN